MVGDRETENEVRHQIFFFWKHFNKCCCMRIFEIILKVLLLEHDIPHGPFSDAVCACLPQVPWHPPNESHRKDLRSLTICSVDPPGCTDIDDALHCMQIASDRFEVITSSFRNSRIFNLILFSNI